MLAKRTMITSCLMMMEAAYNYLYKYHRRATTFSIVVDLFRVLLREKASRIMKSSSPLVRMNSLKYEGSYFP